MLSVTHTHDDIGNLISDGTWTYTWEGGRRLASMAKSGTNVSFTYDRSGQRLTKTVGNTTTRYTYWGNKLLMFNDGTNYGNVRYDDKGQAIALRYKSKEYFFIYNAQGDVVAIAKANGTVVVEYTYDAWGKILSCTGSMASTLGKYNPFRYRGYVYDEETGLYYLNSRYYDPKVGRFICADGYASTGQGLLGMNVFAYCGNKPSDRKDSNGAFYDSVWEYHKMRQEYAQMGIDYSAMYKPLNGKLLPDLDIATAPAYSYNCFGNAIKKKTTVGIMGYTYGMDTEDVFSLVQKEIGINYVRRLDGIDSPLDSDEYMVAMKCGERDYHFIRRDDEGWYNKSGLEIGVRVDECFVENDPWYAKWRNLNGGEMDGIDPYVYTTIYFAIKAGWDQQ